MTINGNYNGPTDFTSQKDYQLTWKSDGENILESGSSTLMTSSGQAVPCVWSSKIPPETKKSLSNFPPQGEQIDVSFSPFQINGNTMSYTWTGTVKKQSEKDK